MTISCFNLSGINPQLFENFFKEAHKEKEPSNETLVLSKSLSLSA